MLEPGSYDLKWLHTKTTKDVFGQPKIIVTYMVKGTLNTISIPVPTPLRVR